MTKIQIKNRFDGSVIFETDAESVGAALAVAVLARANLSGANLSGVDLTGADLYRADLSRANLSWANLYRADLYRANLYGIKISEANLARVLAARTILPDGDLIGWKKLSSGRICKLKIPEDAKRVGGLIGRKCRAEYAVVLEGEGESRREAKIHYKPGHTVRPDSYDPNPLLECSNGIHFFITRAEAEMY